jgi:hypothetical protein
VIHFQSQKKQKNKLKESKTDTACAGWLRPFAIKLKTADAAAAAGFLVSFWRCTRGLRGRGTPSSSAASKQEKSNTKATATNFYQDNQQHSRDSSVLELGSISLSPPPTQFITLKRQKKAALSV